MRAAFYNCQNCGEMHGPTDSDHYKTFLILNMTSHSPNRRSIPKLPLLSSPHRLPYTADHLTFKLQILTCLQTIQPNLPSLPVMRSMQLEPQKCPPPIDVEADGRKRLEMSLGVRSGKSPE